MIDRDMPTTPPPAPNDPIAELEAIERLEAHAASRSLDRARWARAQIEAIRAGRAA